MKISFKPISMDLKKQLKLNACLALIFALLLIAGETIRRYGDWGHWSRWADDYFMGLFLILPAIMILKGFPYGRALLTGGWGFNSGLLYGSFFSKFTDPGHHFQSNIEPSLLIGLIGLAFVTATLALLWILAIEVRLSLKVPGR